VKLKIGDKVRFLNEAIEGSISKILSNEKVEVMDSHGFVHISDEKHLVLIELVLDEEQISRNHKEEENVPASSKPQQVLKNSNTLVHNLEEDNTIYAAVRLMNEKSPLTTDVELFVVNNTSFSLCFTASKKLDDIRSGLSLGQLKPKSEVFIGIFSQDELHRFDGFEFQFLFFGINEFKPQHPFIKSFRFSSSDFLDTDFRKMFYKKDDTVLLMPLYVSSTVDNIDVSKLLDKFKREEEEEMKRNFQSRGKFKPEKFTVLTRQKVVDLHIQELVKDYSMMSNSQIISYQINYFMYEMDQALLNRLHKITFIHGVGNGVLRSSIREELKRFPNIKFTEAPREKFGTGATEVEFL
jgi:hypothetical protein